MKKATESRTKKCPVCHKQYPEEDNYCGDDGSVLDYSTELAGEHPAPPSVTPITRDVVNAAPGAALKP